MLQQFSDMFTQWARNWPLLVERLGQPEHFELELFLRWLMQSLALSLIVFLSDYLPGFALVTWARRRAGRWAPPAITGLAGLAAGIALQGSAILALGFAGRLTPRAVTATVAMALAAGALAMGRQRSWRLALAAWRPLAPERRWRITALLLLVLLAPGLALWASDLMQPVAEGDSTMYHMLAARWYLEHRSLEFHPGIRFNAQPHLPVLLYQRHALVLGDDIVLKLFNLELMALLLLALAAGTRHAGHRAGWLPGAVFLLVSPVFCWVIRIEYADLALTALTTAGAVTLAAALERRSAVLVWAAGLTLGLAGAVKLQGLVMAACLGVAFTVLAWKRGWRIVPVAIAVPVLALGAPWWLRSWLATGSPAYPFFTDTLDLQRLMQVNASYGFGHDAGELLMIPVRAVQFAAYKFADPYIFGPGLLLLAAATVWRRPKRTSLWWIALGAFFVFWFFSGQVMRYLSSMGGVMAILWGASARSRAAAIALAGLAGITLLLPCRTLFTAMPPPVTISQKEGAQAEGLSYYRAVREVRKQADPRERTYTWFCEDARYHLATASYGDWFGPYSFFWLASGVREPAEIAERLRRAGFRYLVLDRQRGREKAEMFDFDFAKSDYLRVWGSPPGAARIYDDGRYAAYRLE